MTEEEWMERELAKAPERDEMWRKMVMELWGLKEAA
ncbi:hypothetical protein EES41_23410 [Streptomyces sp. ADI95-16]|nr:hypothetical protein EES41_23410 [Streptomyces sp. ADI95-16]